MANTADHLFMRIGHLYAFPEEMSIQILCLIFNGVVFLLLSYECFMDILDMNPRIHNLQIFSLFNFVYMFYDNCVFPVNMNRKLLKKEP